MGIKRLFKLNFLAALFVQLAFCCTPVFAESSSISAAITEPTSWDIAVESTSTTTFSIYVSTSNENGYSIKMETNSETTDLVHSEQNSSRIPTVVPPEDADSVTIDELDDSYGYSVNGVDFKSVPDIGSGGDLLFENRNPNLDEPNSHEVTFGANAGMYDRPGDYTNVFLITVITNDPIVCQVGYICYERNGADGTNEMANQSVDHGSAAALLTPPKFKRSGYGFAGWNTRKDGTGTTYGPAETINSETALTHGLTLYAKWVESSGELQNFSGCETVAVGSVIALTDNRDGNTYTVSRLSDGSCWMDENLRLDLADSNLQITSANTNNPTQAFMNSVNGHTIASTAAFCQKVNSNCLNQVLYNNTNVNPDSNSYNPAAGSYYNWYTATAGNGLFNTIDSKPVAGDICPAGWRLPRAIGEKSDYISLDKALGGSGENGTTAEDFNRWRKYPINYVLNGQVKDNAIVNINESGNYYASEGTTNERATNLWILEDKLSFNVNTSSKHRGQSVRCMMKGIYDVKFDKNAPNGATIDGSMENQEITRGIDTKLRKNAYSHTYSNRKLYTFRGWNTKSDGSGTSYSDEANVTNLAASGETVTLYAQWDVTNYYELTVAFDENAIHGFTAQGGIYGDASTSSSNETIEVAAGKNYMISFDLDVGYEFVRYEVSAGTLSSATQSPTTFVAPSSSATITIVTKEREHPLYIQNLDSSVCSTTPKLVTDIRDNEQYLIQRLADGKCWMIDDLRLGSKTLVNAISYENTNISSGIEFTLPTPTNNFTTKTNIPQISGRIAGQTIKHFGDTTGQAGMYYNYCAATAGTVCNHSDRTNAIMDICPAGWRMPTGGTGGEQENLFNQFGTVTGMQVGASLTYAGWYTSSTIKEFETASWTWSSTGKSNNKAHVMFIGRTMKSFADGAFEYYGENVRCVLR